MASVDRRASVKYPVEGSGEKMGNGGRAVTKGLASLTLTQASQAKLPFPNESLTIGDLFPSETVTFSFANLPKDARTGLAACFPEAAPSK